MKKVLAGILALLVLMGCALAEASDVAENAAEQDAYMKVGIANDFLIKGGEVDGQLFTNVQELDGVGLGFTSDDGKVSLLCLYDADQSFVETTILLTSDSEHLAQVLYSALAMAMPSEDYVSIMSFANYMDGESNAIFDALESDTYYGGTYEDASGFRMEMMVTPLEEDSRLNLMMYWYGPEGKPAEDGQIEREGTGIGASDAEGEARAMREYANDFLKQIGLITEDLFHVERPMDGRGVAYSSANKEVNLLCLYDADQSRVTTTMLYTSDGTLAPAILYAACALPGCKNDVEGAEHLADFIDQKMAEICQQMSAPSPHNTDLYYKLTDSAAGYDLEITVTYPNGHNRLNIVLEWKDAL